MGKKDPRVDAYIAKSADFAKPILNHLRKRVHDFCPEVVETVKWGMPFFDFKGPFCNMAAFKAHATFGFWKGEVIFGKTAAEQEAMGQFGRMTSLQDVPGDKKLAAFIKLAMKLNEDGVKIPSRSKPKQTKDPAAPPYFLAALKKNKKALATYEGFSPGQKREYVAWVTEAKTEETRQKRLETAVEWMAEGKIRNWKYVR
jgi:uncharacterized protein YdeI (YjbR/CyaY-like superfamily)